MTEAQWAEICRTMKPYGLQDENGIDLAMIDQMLALTPTQRLEALEQFMANDDALTRARIGFYGSDPRTALEAEDGER